MLPPARVTVIIPALNEERSLPRVLEAIPREWAQQIIVVDNGSTDATAAMAVSGGAIVVSEPCRGYGAAMRRGLEEVANRWPHTEIVVFLDGDASDDPGQLPQLVAPILFAEADFVLGSRILGRREPGALTIWSNLGNRLACTLIWMLTGYAYTDLGPFRAIRLDVLNRLEMVDRNFGWTVEMQIKAALAGLRIREIPVLYRCRIGESKISGTFSGSIRAGWKILYTIARYGLWQRSSVRPRESVDETSVAA